MIHPTRLGHARALSSGFLPTYVLDHIIPHAETSGQAARRAIQLQRHRRQYCRISNDLRKGKAVKCHFTAEYATFALAEKEPDETVQKRQRPNWGVKRVKESEEEVGSVTKDWPVDPDFPFHSRLAIPTEPTLDPAEMTIPIQQFQIPPLQQNPLIPPSDRPWTFSDFSREFQNLVRYQPLLSFTSLRDISDGDLQLLSAEDIDALLYKFEDMPMGKQRNLAKMNRDDSGAILQRIQNHLEHLPPVIKDIDAYQPGTRFRGRRLRQFLQLCLLFGHDQMARSLFIRYFPDQTKRDLVKTRDLEALALFLGRFKRFGFIIDCYTHQSFPAYSPNIPLIHWKPRLFCMVGQAFLATRRSEALLELGNLYRVALSQRKRPMHSTCYAVLLQAAISVGNHRLAQKFREEIQLQSETPTKLDSTAQLAIVRGQKALGFDPNVEARVLEDLPAEPDQAAKLLHELIRIRLNNHDPSGAKKMLARFDLTAPIAEMSRFTDAGGLSPTPSTVFLAFEIATSRRDKDLLLAWWGYYSQRPQLLDDKAVSHVIKAMSSVGLLAEAYEMIRARLSDSTPRSEIWHLPALTHVGIISLNSLADVMSRFSGLQGLQDVTDLMRQYQVDADALTLKIVLDAVRRNMTTAPTDLVDLLSAMLERANNVRAQIGHVDSIMAEAVKLASMTKTSPFVSTDATLPLQDPSGGLMPINRYAGTITSILESLRDRAIGSESLSVATRLRFEALIANSGSEVPEVEKVWHEFVSLGYKPDRRHLLALIQGYADAGDMLEAEKSIQLAKKLDIKPTVGMYMVLLTGWARHGSAGIERACEAYEAIKRASQKDPNFGFDFVAVCAMIQAYYRARLWHLAAGIVRTDLLTRSGLDDRAILIGMTALRWSGDEAGAIDLLERRHTHALSFFLRVAVRRIRVHLERRMIQGRADLVDSTTLLRVKEILDKDVQARPYIVPGSLFARPANDKIPRGNTGKSANASDWGSIYRERLAEMVSSKTKVVPPKTLRALSRMIEASTPDAPNMDALEELRAILDQRYGALAAELISLRPKDDPRSRLVLDDTEKSMIEREMETYEEDIMRLVEKGTSEPLTPELIPNDTPVNDGTSKRQSQERLERRAEAEARSKRAASYRLSRQRESMKRAAFEHRDTPVPQIPARQDQRPVDVEHNFGLGGGYISSATERASQYEDQKAFRLEAGMEAFKRRKEVTIAVEKLRQQIQDSLGAHLANVEKGERE